MRCSLVLLGTSFDVGKFCTVLSQSCCAAFLPLVLSSLSCAPLVIVQWLGRFALLPSCLLESWSKLVPLGPACADMFFCFCLWVLGWVPDSCARFRSAHASRAPPGLGCCLVLTCRPCPRAMISVRARLYLVGACALVALATASPLFMSLGYVLVLWLVATASRLRAS